MVIIHLGCLSPNSSSDLPGNASLPEGRTIERAAQNAFPYLVLHREEFTQPRVLPHALVRSYRTVSPITEARNANQQIFF